jgi:hypothetical protein
MKNAPISKRGGKLGIKYKLALVPLLALSRRICLLGTCSVLNQLMDSYFFSLFFPSSHFNCFISSLETAPGRKRDGRRRELRKRREITFIYIVS